MREEDFIAKAKLRFKEAQKAEADMRETSLSDVKFASGEQWDDTDRMERSGRPTLTINKVGGALKMIRGNQRRTVPSIRVSPVDGDSDPEVAQIYNGLIRSIEYNSDAEAAYDTAFDGSIDGGWGYLRIDAEYAGDDMFEQELVINRITNQYGVYFDPSYKKADSSDKKWAFISEMMSKEAYKEKYGEEQVSDWESSRGEGSDEWFTQDGVRVVEYWYLEPVTRVIYQLATGEVLTEPMLEANNSIYDKDRNTIYNPQIPEAELQVTRTRDVKTHRVMWCRMSGDAVLEKPVERKGKYIPIIIVMGEEKYIDGKRRLKSAHHDAKDSQKVYNWMVSTSVETVSQAPKQPWIVTAEQVEGHERAWDIAHRRPMSRLVYNHIPGQPVPQRQMGSITDSGAMNERMAAADDIKATTGFFDASLGARSNETSGVAISKRQLESDTSSFVFTDNLRRALTFAGKVLVDLIPYYYDSERIIRILGKDGTESFVAINKTVVDKETAEKQTLNDVTKGKFDVVVEIGASFNTQRQEAEARMVELIRNVPAIAPQILDLVVKNMDFPGAEEIYERLRAMMESQGEEPEPDPGEVLDAQKKKADLQGRQIANAKGINDLFNELAESSGSEQIDKAADQSIMEVIGQMRQG